MDNAIFSRPRVYIGCAGWSIPKEYAERFPEDGSHLERYAQRLNAVEINSSFYRPHQPATYARWAEATPAGFRFSVKVPREITHARRLSDAVEPLDRFLSEVQALGDKLGPLLVQLPPSLAFDRAVVSGFFEALRARFAENVVCEPRHASWFLREAEKVLADHHVARAAADPAPASDAARPGGWDGLVYYRLHGSPRIYYSDYSEEYLDDLAQELKCAAQSASVWCIFDNTALGAATANALQPRRASQQPRKPFESIGVADGVAFAVVVEVGEDVLAHPLPFPDAVRPPAQVVVGVGAAVEIFGVRPMQAHIDERGRRPQDARQICAAHHAVAGAVLFQQGEDFFPVPGRMAQLHGRLLPRGSRVRK